MITTKRDLLARVIPRQIAFLEFINNNVEFIRLRSKVFGNAMVEGDRQAVHSAVADVVGRSCRIQYLEFGVFRGESILKWAEEYNRHSASRFAGFDTFTGLPEDWTKSHPTGTFNVGGRPPTTADTRVSFVSGLFQDTLETFLDNQFVPSVPTVIHIDCDLYSATLFVLASLHRVLEPGTCVIFDDFYSMNHEFRAFLDFCRAFNCQWTALAATQSCNTVAIRLE